MHHEKVLKLFKSTFTFLGPIFRYQDLFLIYFQEILFALLPFYKIKNFIFNCDLFRS